VEITDIVTGALPFSIARLREKALMNMQAIEAVVRRLFSDATFRADAIADPAAALAEYRLAAAEQQALTKLCAQLGGGGQLAMIRSAGWWW